MNSLTKYKKLLSELGLFYSAAIWGSTFFIVKDALKDVDPVILVEYRFLLAAVPLGISCLIARKPILKNVQHGLLAGIILWLLYVSQTIGLGVTTASNSGFITGLFVAFVPFFSLAIFRRRPVLTDIVATIVSLFGLWMLTGGLTDINVGDLFTLVAAAAYALHILVLDKYIKDGDDPYLLSFQQFLLIGALSLLTGGILGLPHSVMGAETAWVILFLALLPTLSAFVVQVVAQKIVNPFRVSLIFAFEPVFAGLFAWTLGNEPIILHRASGGLLIFLGMVISGIRPRPKSEASMKKRVLFICTHNSARSQMAEGFLNALYGDRYEGASAGTEPTKVNPYAVKVMAEIGIDISTHRSKSIEDFRGENLNYVVTVCNNAKETCPFFPGEKILHKDFEDPSDFKGTKDEILREVRRVRDEIKDWIEITFGREHSQTK